MRGLSLRHQTRRSTDHQHNLAHQLLPMLIQTVRAWVCRAECRHLSHLRRTWGPQLGPGVHRFPSRSWEVRNKMKIHVFHAKYFGNDYVRNSKIMEFHRNIMDFNARWANGTMRVAWTLMNWKTDEKKWIFMVFLTYRPTVTSPLTTIHGPTKKRRCKKCCKNYCMIEIWFPPNCISAKTERNAILGTYWFSRQHIE